MKTYWSEEGKYQAITEEIGDRVPSWGMTTNAYMNLYITACNLYYDVYNNGGCNLDCYADRIEKYILPFNKDIKGARNDGKIDFSCKEQTVRRNLKNHTKLENFMNAVIEFVSGQDLEYTKYTTYYNFGKELMSLNEHTEEGWSKITFGLEEEWRAWTENRNKTYKMID